MDSSSNRLRGHYSLVQYCPDTARLEVANIGVVLFCAERQYLRVRMTSNHKRINQMFGRGKRDLTRLRVVKEGLERKLESKRQDLQILEQLERFAALQVNNLQMTQFMPCRIKEDPDRELNSLYSELVVADDESLESTMTPLAMLQSKMDDLFDRPDLRTRVRRDLMVTIPILRREQRVPYAYKNGRVHLISPLQFPKRTSAVEDKAARFAVEGKSLYENPDDELGEMQMLVVGEFPETKPDDVETVRRILEANTVRLFTSSQLPELADEIRGNGHEFVTSG